MPMSVARQTTLIAIAIALTVAVSLRFGTVGQAACLDAWMALTVVLSWTVAFDVGGYPHDIRVLHAIRGALAAGLFVVYLVFLLFYDNELWLGAATRGVALIAVPVFYPYPALLTIRRRRLIRERVDG